MHATKTILVESSHVAIDELFVHLLWHHPNRCSSVQLTTSTVPILLLAGHRSCLVEAWALVLVRVVADEWLLVVDRSLIVDIVIVLVLILQVVQIWCLMIQLLDHVTMLLLAALWKR